MYFLCSLVGGTCIAKRKPLYIDLISRPLTVTISGCIFVGSRYFQRYMHMSACSCVHSLASRYTIYSNPQHIHRGQGPDLLPVQGFHILAGWSWWSIGPNVAGFMVPCPLHVEFAVGHPGNQSSQKLFDIPDMSESSCLPVWLWLVHWWVILMKKYWKSSYPFLPWAFLKSFCGPQVRGCFGMMYFSICP